MDTVLLILLAYLVFNGVYKGFTGFILKTSGLVVGLYLSIPIYKTVASLMAKLFSAGVFLVDFISFMVVFVFIFSTFLLFEKFIKSKLYKKKMLAITDRLLGGLLGIVIFIFIVLTLVKLEPENVIVSKLVSDSKIVQMFKNI